MSIKRVRPRLYRDMLPAEQTAWVTQFVEFKHLRFPVILAAGRHPSPAVVALIEEGLKLLEAFPQYRSFAADARRMGDYGRRHTLMNRYITDICMSLTEVSHRPLYALRTKGGRPSAHELELRERQERIFEAQRAHDEAIDRLNNVPTDREFDLTPLTPAEPPLEAQPLVCTSLTATPQPDGSTQYFAIKEVVWLLSSSLRTQCKELGALRQQAADAANQAKELAERGVASSLIEPHTRASIECTDRYESILAMVDLEIAAIYTREQRTPDASWRTEVERRGYNYKAYLSRLSAHAERAMASDATRKLHSERRTIREYFTRKDVRLTPERLVEMERRLQRAIELGMDVTRYSAILHSSREAMMAQAEQNAAPQPTPEPESEPSQGPLFDQ